MRAAYASEFLRRYGTVGFDGHGELVVIEDLTFACVLDLVGHLADRRIKTVDRYETDGRVLGAVALSRNVSFARVDREFHTDLGTLVERAKYQVRIENHDVADSLDVAGSNRARSLLFHHHSFRAFALHLDGDVLDVEHHVGDILAHTCDRGKLMQHAVNMHRLHSRALQRRQKNAAQRIAERDPKATFERFGDHSRNPRSVAAGGNLELVRPYQFLPILLDHVFTFSAARSCRA